MQTLIALQDECHNGNHYFLIHVDNFSLDIGTVYRKPESANLNDFLDNYSTKLHKIKRGIIFGDYNINLLCSERSSIMYNEILQETGFRVINKVDKSYSTR